MTKRHSVVVLEECIELQNKKAEDYQNPQSSITQAMHYRRGVDTIHDMIHQKVLRAQSLLESGNNPNHEALEDTYKDIINYASFAVTYLRGKMEGQRPNNIISSVAVEPYYNKSKDKSNAQSESTWQDAGGGPKILDIPSRS